MASLKKLPKMEDDPLNEKIEVSQEQAKDPESGEDSEEDIKKTEDVGTDIDREPKLPMRETRFKMPFSKDSVIAFNPAVSLIGLVPLWALAAFCMAQPEVASTLLNEWFQTVIDAFTWFYIGKLLMVQYVSCEFCQLLVALTRSLFFY